MSAPLLSSAAIAVLFALAALVVLKESRQARVPLALALLALALAELFDRLALDGHGEFARYKRLGLFSSSLVPAFLLLYGLLFVKRGVGGSKVLAAAPLLVTAAVFSATALLLPADRFFAGLGARSGRYLPLEGVGYWFHLGLMIFCTAALVHLESVFAGIRGAARSRVRYEFLGVGAILAVMIFSSSQALLYKAVALDLLPARSSVALAAALLIGYSRLFHGKLADLAVSRQAVYRSVSLVAVGLYLVVLGLLGEGMRRFNITLSHEFAVFIAVLGGVAFLAILASGEVRGRLKVFLSKHFYAQKYDYREEWLGFTGALAGCGSLGEVRGAILERYRQIFGLRSAFLYTWDGGAGSFALAGAPDGFDAPRRAVFSPGLLGYFAETGRVLNPADGEYTPDEAEAAFLRDSDAWLLAPLMARERLEAFVVLGRQVVPARPTYEDFDLVRIVGRQAMLSLQNFRLSEELSEAREMAAVAKVSSFVIHDLKNLAYTFSLMMENADEHIGEPEFQSDLVKSIRGTVAKMNALIAKLKVYPEKKELAKEAVDLGRVARETLEEIKALRPSVAFRDECEVAGALADPQEIRKVVLNLLLNACDALGGQGNVVLRTGLRDREVFVVVEDDGCGMSRTFVEELLFRPFRTTKEKGLGIGLYQCKQIVEAHGGRIEADSTEGEGTAFTVTLPRHDGAVAREPG